MRSERSFDELVVRLEASRRELVERLRTTGTPHDVALKEEVEWAIGCLRLCRKLDISPSDRAYEIVSPVRTPSAQVRLVSDNESDRPEWWTELKIEGQEIRLSDGDVVVVKGNRVTMVGPGSVRSSSVWAFVGSGARFPAGVFSSQAAAEDWIAANQLSGILTEYPLDQSAYEWAVSRGLFAPTKPEHKTPKFIASFTSASQRHCHYGHADADDEP